MKEREHPERERERGDGDRPRGTMAPRKDHERRLPRSGGGRVGVFFARKVGRERVQLVARLGSVGTVDPLRELVERQPPGCEVSAQGRTAVMSDFREVTLHEGRSRKRSKHDGGKGHTEEIAHFVDVVRGRAEPAFSIETLVDTTAATFAAVESIRSRAAIEL